ncbi:MAG: UDP-N-acetylmuramoyl-L-alanine--D-glutamate ligase [Anaerolineaceae bacterium]|nr:UDP-N-acetylmuramoyl-L-alanine--D-glutamate ligase [Anaerolineaceae bacterium]
MIGQTALVIGLARQGMAVIKHLVSGDTNVIVTDLRSSEDLAKSIQTLSPYAIDFVLGEHPISLLEGVDIVYVSGGVPLDIPLLQEARTKDIPISNDSQLALEQLPCKVVGITGSSGKTTTTLLVGKIIAVSQNYRNVWVGGNVGNPLLLDMHQMTDQDIAIMELSSFQLAIMTSSPNIAGVLNVSPNHLDRHTNMHEYVTDKQKILDSQQSDDVAVLGWDNEITRAMSDRVRGHCWGFSMDSNANFDDGCFIENETVMLRHNGVTNSIMACQDVRLLGAHNLMNVMAASALAAAAGVEIDAIQAGIYDFNGIPHRMELVTEINGVRWVNDTMATTPDRTIAALKAFEDPVILLLGGRDKKLPWHVLAKEVQSGVKNIILFGEAAPLIKRELEDARDKSKLEIDIPFGGQGDIQFVDEGSGSERLVKELTAGEAADPDPIPVLTNLLETIGMEQAVAAAYTLSDPGDVVLLAPGCTSYDQYTDAVERGECYRDLVVNLS